MFVIPVFQCKSRSLSFILQSEVEAMSQKYEQAQQTFRETRSWLEKCCDEADTELETTKAELGNHKGEIQRLTGIILLADCRTGISLLACESSFWGF